MQVKRIQCPACKVVLDVRNSANESEKTFTCPKCSSVLRVKFLEQAEINNANTVIAGNKIDVGGSTVLANSRQSNCRPRLLCNGKEYALAEGCNIIGRKASSSSATIQISTADMTMSRLHVKIYVTTFPDGSNKVVISNYKNKNETIVEGQKIGHSEEIRLMDGYQIKAGETVLTFKNQ